MLPSFDLFKQECDGGVQWLGEMLDLETACAQALQLMSSSPGEYFVFNQRTGKKLYVKYEERDAESIKSV